MASSKIRPTEAHDPVYRIDIEYQLCHIIYTERIENGKIKRLTESDDMGLLRTI